MILLQHSPTNLIAETFPYALHIQPPSLSGYYELLQGFATKALDRLRGSGSSFNRYMSKGVIARTWEDFLFYARPRTTDLYAIYCEEVCDEAKQYEEDI